MNNAAVLEELDDGLEGFIDLSPVRNVHGARWNWVSLAGGRRRAPRLAGGWTCASYCTWRRNTSRSTGASASSSTLADRAARQVAGQRLLPRHDVEHLGQLAVADDLGAVDVGAVLRQRGAAPQRGDAAPRCARRSIGHGFMASPSWLSRRLLRLAVLQVGDPLGDRRHRRPATAPGSGRTAPARACRRPGTGRAGCRGSGAARRSPGRARSPSRRPRAPWRTGLAGGR